MKKKKADDAFRDDDDLGLDDAEPVDADAEPVDVDAAVDPDASVDPDAVADDDAMIQGLASDAVDKPALPASADEVVAAEPEDAGPPARTSMLTLVLCFLNVAVVLAFTFLAVMDFAARQRWAYLVFRYDLAAQGLPLQEEEKGVSAAHDVAPRMTLDPAWLKEAYGKRGGKAVNEKFRAAEYEPQRIRPQDLDDDFLKETFKAHGGEPVPTLEKEIARLKGKLPGLLDAAAADAGKKAKTVGDKQELLRALLFPLATTTKQVDASDDAVAATPKGNLDSLIAVASKRRMLADILHRMDDFRPYDPNEKSLEKVVALEPAKGGEGLTPERFVVKQDQLVDLLNKRLDESVAAKDWAGNERSGLEKRRTVGFLLFALSRLKGADGKPLYPPTRAEVIVGIRELTQAADTLTLVLEKTENRLLAAIQRDRGHDYVYTPDYRVTDPQQFADKLLALLERMEIPVPDKDGFKKAARQHFADLLGKLSSDAAQPANAKVLAEVKALLAKEKIVITEDKENVGFKVKEAKFDREVLRLADDREQGFVGKHHEVIERIRDLAARIEAQKIRLDELKGQEKELKRQYEERATQEKETRAKLIAAREQTLKKAQDLHRLQDEVYRAQIELAGASEMNRRYERHIRQLELTKKGRKR